MLSRSDKDDPGNVKNIEKEQFSTGLSNFSLRFYFCKLLI